MGVPDVRSPAGPRLTVSSLPLSSLFTLGSRRARFLVERNVYVYRHGWIYILSGFFEPLFYLGSIGFGLGALVGKVDGPGGQPISYQLFVAPALLASAALNGGDDLRACVRGVNISKRSATDARVVNHHEDAHRHAEEDPFSDACGN